jgi:hypothetical protein
MSNAHWLIFIMALPNQNNTLRMKAWRNLKNLGAAVLRDGVYLLPYREDLKNKLNQQVSEIKKIKGSSWLFELGEQPLKQTQAFQELFDRGEEYAEFLKELEQLRNVFSKQLETEVRKQLRQLQRDFANLLDIDYFPHAQQPFIKDTLQQLEKSIHAHFSPQEPQPIEQSLQPLNKADFQHKIWATRQQLWIDRLASGWLIQKFIDSNAQFLWLDDPKNCPKEAIGFDFDGAQFTHTNQYITFETLMIRFELIENKSLKHLADIVHYLDVGGNFVSEAAGIEKILHGIRRQTSNDDQLFQESCKIFDFLVGS